MRQLKITQSITNRESPSLEKYLQEIGKEPLITPDEEVRLAQRIKNGDQQALDKLVRANLRFVVSVAKQYQNQGLSLPDLINEGNLGLIKAADRFDETKGFKFISYAVWWIRQSILQAIAEQSRMVRLPLNQLSTLNKVKKAFSKLEQQYEREPSYEEISMTIEISPERISDSLGNSGYHKSFDEPLVQGGEEKIIEQFSSEKEYPDEQADYTLMHESLRKEIDRSLSTLSEREREVIKLFHGIGVKHSLTLEEIGEKLDLTRERIRQIKEKAIRRLRINSRSKLLKTYLG